MKPEHRAGGFANCSDAVVSVITIPNPDAHTVNLYHGEDVEIRKVKIINARSIATRFAVQSCHRVWVERYFIRGWDDNRVVKGYDGDVSDMIFTDCVRWTDLAQSCEVGSETRACVMERSMFDTITVLHANDKPVCSIRSSGNAPIRDIMFRNITAEDCNLGQGDGAEYLTTTKSQWSKTRNAVRSAIGARTMCNNSGTKLGVRMFATPKGSAIDDVTIRH